MHSADLRFVFDPQNTEIGMVNTTVAVVEGLQIPSDDPPELATLREIAVQRAMLYTDDELPYLPMLAGYHRLYRAIGRNPKRVHSAPESLIRMIRRRERFPRINAAVDSYNTVVVERLLGVGAHDLDRLRGPIVFTRAKGGEMFTPIGGEAKPVASGDFFYRDDDKVLAWLAADDCDEAKLTMETTNVVLILEGHPNTTAAATLETVVRAGQRLTQFCGGKVTRIQQLP